MPHCASGRKLIAPALRTPGQRLHCAQARARKSRSTDRRGRIAFVRQSDPRGQHLFRLAQAGVGLLQCRETAQEKSRAAQEHDRERHLRDDKKTAQPIRARERGLAVQRCLHIGSRNVRSACRAGARPQPIPTAESEERGETQDRCRRDAPRSRQGSELPNNARSRSIPQTAITIPAAPPSVASRMLSARNCLTSRARLAPSASRSAISRWRPAVRARRRLAMFALAIRSTQATLPSRTRSEVRLFRVSCSWSGTSETLRSPCSPGYFFPIVRRDRFHVGLRLRERDAGTEPPDHLQSVIAARGHLRRSHDQRHPKLRAFARESGSSPASRR